jgi:hypothetical protein
MAFKDVLKKQRQSGKGILSSLGSSVTENIREKMDYRNSLFKSGGMLNALFPNVKGFKAGQNIKIPKAETEKTIASMDNTEVVQQLSRVASKLDIVGKNTMALPIMMRDMNVMRQGIVKLVKLSGGTQRDKADRFFQTSAQQEALYESKLAKSKASTTPTNVKQVPEEKKKSLLDTIFDFMPGLFKLVLGGIAAGGIVSLLGKDTVKEGLKTLFTGILNLFVDGVKLSLETISEMMNDPEVTKKFKELGDTLLNFAKDHPFLTLGAAVTMFGGTITSLLGVLTLATTVGKGFLGKAFKLLSLMGLGAAAGAIIAGNNTPEAGTPGAEGQPGVPGTPDAVNTGKSMTKLEGAAAGAEAVGGVVAGVSGVKKIAEVSKATGTAILDARTQSVGQLAKAEATSTWGKFLKFVAKKSPALWGKIGVKLAQAGTLATIPVAGWIGALISLGFAAWTAWDLYELWKEFSGSGEPDVENNSPTPMENTVDAMGNVTGSSGGDSTTTKAVTPTPVSPAAPMTMAKSSGPNSSGSSSSGSLSGGKTFNQMSREEQDQILMNQAIAEGWKKPTSIQHSHNNPGNIIAPGGKVTEAQAKFGGVPGGTYNGLTFVKFPTMQAGWDAQRDLWTRKFGNQPVSQALATWSNAGKDQGAYNKVVLGGGGDSPAPILASGSTPSTMSTSPATVASAPTRPATQIASASTSLADTMRTQMQTPVVINAPTTNNNVRNGGNGSQRSTTTPSIVDSELMKLLVERVAA